MLELTKEEEKLIILRRHEEALQDSRVAFMIKALSTANKFSIWSQLNGDGLTYSTFINTFNYQDEDGHVMFYAVQRILDAAWPQHL